MYRGFFAHYYVHREMDRTNPVVTALLIQASLFARSYFSAVAAGERAKIGGMESWAGRGLAELTDAEKASFAAAVGELSTVVEELYDSVDFASGLCDDKTGKLSPDGDGIPMTVGNAGSLQGEDGCGVGATVYPGKDGLYNFSEAHNYVYLAYQQACGAQPAGECNNTNIELMWNRWQARQIGAETDRYTDTDTCADADACCMLHVACCMVHVAWCVCYRVESRPYPEP